MRIQREYGGLAIIPNGRARKVVSSVTNYVLGTIDDRNKTLALPIMDDLTSLLKKLDFSEVGERKIVRGLEELEKDMQMSDYEITTIPNEELQRT